MPDNLEAYSQSWHIDRVPLPAIIVGVDVASADGSITFALYDGSVIGPLPLPQISEADLMAILEGPDASTVAQERPLPLRSPGRPSPRRALHRSLTSPRQWALRRLVRGRKRVI
jgi:hypothetical protein